MDWKKVCVTALEEEKLFQTSGHKTRFKELVDCYSDYPFFTRGLCKCVYLSAWDEEHFCIMLEMLMAMSLGQETNTEDMRINGDILAEQQKDSQYYIYQLSNAFLDDAPFCLNPRLDIEPEIRYIISQALLAAEVIDNL